MLVGGPSFSLALTFVECAGQVGCGTSLNEEFCNVFPVVSLKLMSLEEEKRGRGFSSHPINMTYH